jgi:hypothetical protein
VQMQTEEDRQKIIATRVSTTLATEVEKKAAEEMLSVSCYLRRLLAAAVREQQRV